MKTAVSGLQRGIQPQYSDEDMLYPDEFRLPRNVAMRGPVERNQSVTGTISMSRMEGWSLEGRAGDLYLLDYEHLSGNLVWTMEVFGPDRELLALTTDSDIGYADFTQLEIKLTG